MMIWHLPSPAKAQKYRVDVLYEGEGRYRGSAAVLLTAAALGGLWRAGAAEQLRNSPCLPAGLPPQPGAWPRATPRAHPPQPPPLPPLSPGPLDDAYATAIRNCDPDGPLMM